MEFNKKQPALLYLDKKGFYFYEMGMGNVVSLAFQETAIKDMDIVNGAALSAQIKTFVEQYQITPAMITMILSPNVTFEKEITSVTVEMQDIEIRKFIDTIPFESVLSKQYPIDKGVKVIGCNEDIYLELKVSFAQCALSIDNVIPYQLLGGDQALVQNLTTENAAQLLKRVDRLKQFTMLAVDKEKPQPATPSIDEKKEGKPKKNNTRLYAMAVIFVVLFAILGFLLLKH